MPARQFPATKPQGELCALVQPGTLRPEAEPVDGTHGPCVIVLPSGGDDQHDRCWFDHGSQGPRNSEHVPQCAAVQSFWARLQACAALKLLASVNWPPPEHSYTQTKGLG